MSETRLLERPPYTMVHNHVLDEIMPSLSPNAWKVLCVAIRQTLGWVDDESPTGRKQRDVISYSQFMEKTGIGSRATLARALSECLDRQVLRRWEAGRDSRSGKPIYEYALNTDYTVSAEAVPLSSSSTETVPLSSTETVPLSSTETVLTKETRRETKNNTARSVDKRSSGEHSSAAAVVDDSLSDLQRRALRMLAEEIKPPFRPYRDARAWVIKDAHGAYGWAIYAKAHGLGGGYLRNRWKAGDPPPPTESTPAPHPRRLEDIAVEVFE
jgi:hypothetical protein